MDIESSVLRVLCNCEVSIMDNGCPIPSTYISNTLAITLYQARKALKSLKEKGFVKSCRCRFYDNYNEVYYLASGYRLTDAAKETEEYKQAVDREVKICEDVYGKDFGSAVRKVWQC